MDRAGLPRREWIGPGGKIPLTAHAFMWLGYWRDHLPPKAVEQLQDILEAMNDAE